MKTFLFLILPLLWVAACTPSKEMANITEGVKGTVVWTAGNQMPSIDGTGRKPSEPVQREVYFCPPQRMDANTQSAFVQGIDKIAVMIVKTDEKGKFAVSLKPGKYSVFTKEKQGFFANIYNGEGFINLVEVLPGKMSEINIDINYEAAY